MMKTKLAGAFLFAALFAVGAARADIVLSDFNNTGFSSVGSGTETVGPTFDTLAKDSGTFSLSGDLNYEPDGVDLTGLTGFNITYTLTLGPGSSPTVYLGFFVRDLSGVQTGSFIQVPASSTFVTSFVPIANAEGVDLSSTRFVRFSSSDPNFNANYTSSFQIDNITAVGATAAPEPQAWILTIIAGSLALAACKRRRLHLP